MLRTSTLLALLCLAPAVLAAQEPAPAGPRPASFCFRPHPGDRCRSFLVTEVSRSTREFGAYRGLEDKLQWEWGAMVNLGEDQAVGATYVFGEPKSGHRGVSLRYRRWLNRGIALDVAPGAIVVGNDYDGRRVRLTAHTAVTLGNVLGLFAHGESSRDGGQLGAGAKLASWPGLVVGLGVYTLIAIIPET
ncbi:MAG TPA: hypothetical protein VFQ76_21730 [Longimicrobiaceae bacterium]|nr:hypothetical protein [Longimicrobiaceae bacterium]